MNLLDSICFAVGKIGRCLFEVVKTIFKYVIELIADVFAWAKELLNRCIDKIREGWRMYYIDVDIEKIPPSVIPRDRLKGATKVSLGIMTDKAYNPKVVDRAFVHTSEDNELKMKMGNTGSLELVV